MRSRLVGLQTEDQPLIKAYDESVWSRQADALAADVNISLTLIDGLHARWVDVYRRMSDTDFKRAFDHPETGKFIPLRLWHILSALSKRKALYGATGYDRSRCPG